MSSLPSQIRSANQAAMRSALLKLTSRQRAEQLRPDAASDLATPDVAVVLHVQGEAQARLLRGKVEGC